MTGILSQALTVLGYFVGSVKAQHLNCTPPNCMLDAGPDRWVINETLVFPVCSTDEHCPTINTGCLRGDDDEFASLYTVYTHLGNGTGCRTATMVPPLLLTSSPARCEAALHDSGTSPGGLFYARATLFPLYHGGSMIYKMRRRKPEPTLFLTQSICTI